MAAGFKTATVNASDVPATQTNFPAYVDLSRLGITTLAEAQSVRVYADSGKTTEWAREIVSATEMWVKVPSLTSTTEIYVDWDGSRADYAATDTYGRNAVWSDYLAVYHLNNATDSAGNSDLTATSISYVTGYVGNGADFGGSSKLQGTIASGLGGSFYVTGWVKHDNLSGERAFFESHVASYNNYWAYANFTGTTSSRLALYNGTQNPFIDSSSGQSTATWYKYTWVRDVPADTIYIYRNGASHSSTATDTTTSVPTYSNFSLGRRVNNTVGMDGILDEVRVRGSLFSADWETTEYNNQSDEATFWGTWTDVGGGAPTGFNLFW